MCVCGVQVAHGFLDVANEAMCRPIRELTQMRGYDTATHALACFGGAGGQVCAPTVWVGACCSCACNSLPWLLVWTDGRARGVCAGVRVSLACALS